MEDRNMIDINVKLINPLGLVEITKTGLFSKSDYKIEKGIFDECKNRKVFIISPKFKIHSIKNLFESEIDFNDMYLYPSRNNNELLDARGTYEYEWNKKFTEIREHLVNVRDYVMFGGYWVEKDKLVTLLNMYVVKNLGKETWSESVPIVIEKSQINHRPAIFPLNFNNENYKDIFNKLILHNNYINQTFMGIELMIHEKKYKETAYMKNQFKNYKQNIERLANFTKFCEEMPI